MYTLEEKADLIVKKCLDIASIDLYRIFSELVACDFIKMHGPEHHIIDGASVIVAYYNSGGEINLKEALQEMVTNGIKIPGSICKNWGICGSAASVGAALAIIDRTEPLKEIPTWSAHMECTSNILMEISQLGNPRCCKRSAIIALKHAAKYLIDNYDAKILWHEPQCTYHERNDQCIGERCSFYSKKKAKIAFICKHNSCRSQIAEALGRHYCGDDFESYSAGSEAKGKIDEMALRLMKEMYGIDMEKKQYPKLCEDIPKPDILVSVGHGAVCHEVAGGYDQEWGIEDPTGMDEAFYKKIIKQIEQKVLNLKEQKLLD